MVTFGQVILGSEHLWLFPICCITGIQDDSLLLVQNFSISAFFFITCISVLQNALVMSILKLSGLISWHTELLSAYHHAGLPWFSNAMAACCHVSMTLLLSSSLQWAQWLANHSVSVTTKVLPSFAISLPRSCLFFKAQPHCPPFLMVGKGLPQSDLLHSVTTDCPSCDSLTLAFLHLYHNTRTSVPGTVITVILNAPESSPGSDTCWSHCGPAFGPSRVRSLLVLNYLPQTTGSQCQAARLGPIWKDNRLSLVSLCCQNWLEVAHT